MKRPIQGILFSILLAFAGNAAFAQIDTNAREIPWQLIKDENILWKKRVWREINVYERQNASLTDAPQTPRENVFGNVLLSGINAGAFQPYADDLFVKGQKEENEKEHWDYGDTPVSDSAANPFVLSHPLTKEEVKRRIACDPANFSTMTKCYLNFYALRKNDSLLFPAEQAETKKTKRKKREHEMEPGQEVLINDTTAVPSCIYPQQVSHYAIIEDWIFDKDKGKMIVHIAAIAPLVNSKALFWLRYPDIRRYIARYEAYNGKTSTGYTFDEYFESRQFASKITNAAGPSDRTEFR